MKNLQILSAAFLLLASVPLAGQEDAASRPPRGIRISERPTAFTKSYRGGAAVLAYSPEIGYNIVLTGEGPDDGAVLPLGTEPAGAAEAFTGLLGLFDGEPGKVYTIDCGGYTVSAMPQGRRLYLKAATCRRPLFLRRREVADMAENFASFGATAQTIRKDPLREAQSNAHKAQSALWTLESALWTIRHIGWMLGR